MNTMFHSFARFLGFFTLSSLRRLAPVFILLLTSTIARPQTALYSANSIGYQDVALFAGSNLVSNPLFSTDNTISNLFRDFPAGSQMVMWDTTTQDFQEPNVRAEDGSWSPANPELLLGEAVFLHVDAPTRLSFTGQPWPRQCMNFSAGISLISELPETPCFTICIEGPCFEFPVGTSLSYYDPATQTYSENLTLIHDAGTGSSIWVDDAFEVGSPSEFARGTGARLFLPNSVEGQLGNPTEGVSPVRLIDPVFVDHTFQFQFHTDQVTTYRVRRATGSDPVIWSTVTNSILPSEPSGPITVIDHHATNRQANYVVDLFALSNPVRGESTFSFDFYADDSRSYRVHRISPIGTEPSEIIQTIVAPPNGGWMTVTDETATGSSAYYYLLAE